MIVNVHWVVTGWCAHRAEDALELISANIGSMSEDDAWKAPDTLDRGTKTNAASEESLPATGAHDQVLLTGFSYQAVVAQ